MNDEQKNAAQRLGNPTLVVAGPGTGKTTTLVGRYQFLIEKNSNPSKILCCTFSRRAADDLKKRIVSNSQPLVKDPVVHTFHGLAISILKSIGSQIGIAKDFKVWSNNKDRSLKIREFIKSDLKQQAIQILTKEELDPYTILEFIDNQRENLIDPEDASIKASSKGSKKEIIYAEIYALYESFLSTTNLLDFPRMVQKAVEALESDIESKGNFFKKFQHVLVDEYQDINFSQKILTDLFVSGGAELWVVGDDLQSIYGWRGSDIRYILNFQRDYADAKVVQLERNYRSGAHILQLANNLSQFFLDKYPKNLKNERSLDGEVYLETAANFTAEAKSIVAEVKKQIHAGVKPNEIAILSRTNQRPRLVATSLIRAGISVSLNDGVAVFSDYNSKILIAASSIACGLWPNAKWPRLNKDLYAFSMKLKEEERPWQSKISALATFIRNRSQINKSEKEIEASDNNLDDCEEFLKLQEDINSGLRLIENTMFKNSKQGVFVGTIHSAKGLEWTSVFVLGLEDGHLPQRQEVDVQTYEEERRIAFVAITRAKDFLLLTQVLGNKDNSFEPSPFLLEMFGKPEAEAQEPNAHTEEQTKENNKVLSTIKALLRKWSDPAATAAEKEAALIKAKKLMKTHGYRVLDNKIVKVQEKVLERSDTVSAPFRRNVKINEIDETTISRTRQKRWADYQERVINKSVAEYQQHEIAEGSGDGKGWDEVSGGPGFLLDAGYSVRKDGPSSAQRQKILRNVFLGVTNIPEGLRESVKLQWGDPGSHARLQKMRNSLNISIGLQKGRSNPSEQAINKWVVDISYLDEKLTKEISI